MPFGINTLGSSLFDNMEHYQTLTLMLIKIFHYRHNYNDYRVTLVQDKFPRTEIDSDNFLSVLKSLLYRAESQVQVGLQVEFTFLLSTIYVRPNQGTLLTMICALVFITNRNMICLTRLQSESNPVSRTGPCLYIRYGSEILCTGPQHVSVENFWWFRFVPA